MSYFIGFLLCFILFLNTQNNVNAVVANSHLKYFGYLQTQGSPAGAQNYLPEIGTLHNSNVAQIYAELYAPTMNAYLDSAAAENMQTLLTVQWVFVESIVPGVGGKNSAQLYINWRDRWNTLKTIIAPRQEDIYAFYFDEPFYIGISEVDFRAITAQIRADFPTSKILGIEAYTEIQNEAVTANYIEYLTDYGFDFYYTVYGNTWSDYTTIFSTLKQLAPNKRLWIVADGYINNLINKPTLITSFENYFALANSDSQVIGILTFLYSPLNQSDIQYSLRDIFDATSPASIPQLKVEHIDVGKSILANNPFPSPSTSQQCLSVDRDFDGKITMFDLVKLILKFSTNCVPNATIPTCESEDANGDGVITALDIMLLLKRFPRLSC